MDIYGKSTISMAIFYSYVQLPEPYIILNVQEWIKKKWWLANRLSNLLGATSQQAIPMEQMVVIGRFLPCT